MAEFKSTSDKKMPQVGLKFKSTDEAWSFWVAYGGHIGFDVRKRYTNLSKYDGKVTSCRYVCSNEGHRRKGLTDRVTKCFRAETRTDCKVRVTLTLDRAEGNYEVTDVMLEHNHQLQLPETCHLMASQRKISELQAFEIQTADDSGIRPKAAHELASRQVGGAFNLSYTCRDLKNYLQSKRQRELAFGQAGSMLKYFHDQIAENPSFQYALQRDCEEHITNIFWADAKMILDYAYFGDVITFDTTFGTNKEYRPFGVFLGLNQFRETTIFGAALLFDETEASFTWLFETFLAAHNRKQPKTIYTDQDAAMGKAVQTVFTSSYHGLCTFHIMQNAFKHLTLVKKKRKRKRKRKRKILPKHNAIKAHLKSDFDIVRFLKHFERTVQEKRRKELDSEFESRKKLPRRLMCTPMLVQASQAYTPVVFEAFQSEYKRSMAACARVLDGDNKYVVAIGSLHGDLSFEEERVVIGDPLNQKASCNCGMFERTEILCAHGLKVLDLINVKILPKHYILKRWTREARNGSIQDREGRNVIENPKPEAQHRYKFLSHKFDNIAKSYPECCVMLDNGLDWLSAQLEDKLNLSTCAMKEPCNEQENSDPNVQQRDDCLSAAKLKKKEVRSKGSRRQRSWIDKLRKRKPTKPAGPTKKEQSKKRKKNDVQTQIEVDNAGSNKGTNLEVQEYSAITSFTQILTAPICVDDDLLDHDLF